MKVIGLSLVLILLALGLNPAPVQARACSWTPVTYTTNGFVVTELEMVCSGLSQDPEETKTTQSTQVGQAACIGLAAMFGYDPSSFCANEPDEPEVTPGLVAAALRRTPLPPSKLLVQPPNGRTLVNFDTNFYTQTEPLDRTIRLLGQRVDLHITPASYTWTFGDGATTATESAGSPYPHLEITHSYTHTGTVGPAVATTYTADYRVNGGPWRPVPGTVTIPGTTVGLEVVEATPTLVGYH